MGWVIREDQLTVSDPDVLSTLFCVGNGQSTTRGTLSEQRWDAYRGVYLSGLYTRAPWGLVYFMGAPDWLAAWVEADHRIELVGSRRELDLASGVLRRTARSADGAVEIEEERFASWADEDLVAQRYTVTVHRAEQPLRIVLGLDGEVRNHRAKYYQPGQFPLSDETGLKLSRIQRLEAEDGRLSVVLRARASESRAEAHAIVRQVSGPELSKRALAADGRAMMVFEVPPGNSPRTFTFEKLCAVTTETGGFPATTYDAALTKHIAEMQRFWDLADVRIEGEDAAQLAVRFAIWSTRIAAPLDGGRSSIGAKNLTGDWYRGAVFWDMEMFQLPLLAAVAPQRARNHVQYRANRLPAARVLAAQDGYDGARYPWQSYASGTEEPPQLGGFLYQQQHVNLAVAWGIWHYHAMTGDSQFLRQGGMDVLADVCRFFCSRAVPGEDGKYHIRGVCGPDENHPNVTDNAYTNRMVIWLLRITAALMAELDIANPDKARWDDVAANLCVPMLRENVFAVCQGYADLPEPDDALEAQGLGADKRSKQADTLMLFQALGHELPRQMLEACFAEYAPLCHQTSSLSLSTHALLAIRLGLLRDALRFFGMTVGVDLADKMGNTRDGIHAAAQGGIWMAAVWGFGGLTVGDRVNISPMLPPAWKSLSYKFLLRGQTIAVDVSRAQFAVRNDGSRPVELDLAGRATSIAPGQTVTVPHEAPWRPARLGAVIFDLDGVLVSTDMFHYLAWKELADELGIPFDQQINHRLRGVSREGSLRLIYGDRPLPPEDTFKAQCDRKNARYLELVNTMTPADVLPGALKLLKELRAAGIKIGIASASRNCRVVLERTGLMDCVDGVCDGNNITAGKPDPQVFYVAAQRLRVLPWNCVGVEDAAAGIESIHRAGMAALGIGPQARGADVSVPDISHVTVRLLEEVFAGHESLLDPYMERSLAHIKREVQAGYAATMAFGVKK